MIESCLFLLISHDGLPRWVAVFEEMFADLTEQINSHRWLLCLRESPEPAQQVDFQYGPFTKRFRGTGVRFWFQLDRKRQGFRTGKVLVEIVQTGLVSDVISLLCLLILAMFRLADYFFLYSWNIGVWLT